MLLGYDKDGEIKFYFTDDNYLRTYFPDDSAKISNFLKFDHGLKKLFIDFKDFRNFKFYKVIDGKIVKKDKKEIQKQEKGMVISKKAMIRNEKSLKQVENKKE